MIYQAILKIRGKEIPILYYNYRCHIQHHDDSNLRRIIQLHIQVCEEIGNRENLPVEGDLITLAFECSRDEAFFYDWLNEGMMQDGEIHFIYNEVEVADIFRFWDCYCVKIEEYMSVGNAPMMMVVYLSPGIIKRNNLEVREKVWKVSEIMQNTNVISNEKKVDNTPVVLVKSVEGAVFTFVCQTVNYHVTSYSIPSCEVTENEKRNIKWIIFVDNKEINLSQKGDFLNLYILPEWQGKEILVMPYLKKYTPKVSAKTKIEYWKLPRLFAKSQNWPGKDKNGAIPADLKYGDMSNDEILKINKMNALHLSATDELLFFDFQYLVNFFTIFGGKENAKNLIQHFKNSTGTLYTSEYMNQALSTHPMLAKFIYEPEGVINKFNNELKKESGNINNIKLLQGTINSSRVKFPWKYPLSEKIANNLSKTENFLYKLYYGLKDLTTGMTIAVDDTSAYLIYVESYELISPHMYNAILRIEIYDNFGLNPEDIECGYGLLAGFRSWFILQHARGYKPFLTKMVYRLHINNEDFMNE